MPALASLALLLAPAAAAARLPAGALPVPLVRQAAPHTCGAAVLLSVLQYWQAYDGGEAALQRALGTTENAGTPPDRIAAAAESFGLTAYLAENMTLEDLGLALE